MGRVGLVPLVPPVAVGNLLPVDSHRQLIRGVPSGMIVTGASGHIGENPRTKLSENMGGWGHAN